MRQLHQTLFQYASSTLYRMDECDRVERARAAYWIMDAAWGRSMCIIRLLTVTCMKNQNQHAVHFGTGSVAEAFHSQAMATAHGDKSVTIMVCHKENISLI